MYAGGLDVNAEQIRRDMAWIYRQYNKDRSLLTIESEAKSAKRGLWSEPNAIPPWEYRHGGRAGSPAGSKSAQALAKVKASGSHQCDAKRYCNEMASCEEARFYLTQCGLTRLDRDGDEVPCESLGRPKRKRLKREGSRWSRCENGGGLLSTFGESPFPCYPDVVIKKLPYLPSFTIAK